MENPLAKIKRGPLVLAAAVALGCGLSIGAWQIGRRLSSQRPTVSQPASSTAVFSLASQPPAQRRDLLQQLTTTAEASLARYLLAVDWLGENQPDQALAALGPMDGEIDYGPLTPYALLRHGQAQGGNLPNSWQRLLQDYPTHGATAEVRYALAESDPAQADQLLANHPNHPRSVELAVERLQAGPSKGLMLLVAAHGLYHPQYESVLDRLVETYGSDLTPEQWATVGFGYWENLRYASAAAAYAQAPATPVSLYRAGRGAQIGGQTVNAIAAYQKLDATFPEAAETGLGLIKLAEALPDQAAIAPLDQVIQRFPDRAGQALLAKARILDRLQSPASAESVRNILLEQYGSSEAAAELRLSQAHQAADSGDLASASQLVAAILADSPESERAPEASFWAGKWASQQGQDSRSAYQLTLSQYPESYFAWRAAAELGWEVGSFETVRALAPTVAPPAERQPLPAGSDTLQLLYQLGLDQTAWNQWQTEFVTDAEPTVAEQFTDGVLRVGVGDNLDGIFMLTSLAWRDDEADQEAYEQLRQTATYWQTVYPFPFGRLIQTWSQQRQLNPLLVTALIRQESRFEPQIRSSVGAVGLMQVMPDTARWILDQLAESVSDLETALTTPDENIRLGTWYLDYTHREYDNNSMFAVASYNAGPGNVADWIARGYGDPDYFVRDIPFPETQGYVESVFGGYWNYLRIYNPAIRQRLASLPKTGPRYASRP